ncbi:MAG: transaldolase [Oligoflexales bacterium]|nr:transaldolase [Oligoflexales bacterium]
MAPSLPKLKVALFADGADQSSMLKHYRAGIVQGFTTNPTLMAKAGIKSYEDFGRAITSEIKNLPISFEVFSDDFDEMRVQAKKIAGFGENVNVKIPISNTKGESSLPLIKSLLSDGIKLNVTALLTHEQVKSLRELMSPVDDVIVSIFAGRIGDTGVDPMPLMREAVEMFAPLPKAKVLWASTREALNIYQAEECGCHIITLSDDLLSKLSLYKKSLSQYSLETVQMFRRDAVSAGFTL